MIDNYAIATLIIRALSCIFLLMVFRCQVQEWRRNDGALKRFKTLLMLTTVSLFFASVASIIFNLFRQQDGNLIEAARHFSQIVNSGAVLVVAISMYLIYNYRETK